MLKKFLNNELYKTISYNGVIVFFKVVSSFIASKVTAIYLGPSGYALVGNFKNVLQGLLGFTSTGFESGIIKYVSEHRSDDQKLKFVVSNVFTLNFIICCIIIIPLLFFSEELSIFTLKDASFSYIFKYLAFLMPLISFSFLIVYMVNGLQKFKLYTTLVSISNILNALLTFLFIYLYGLKGALMASLFVPSSTFALSFLFREIRIFFFEALKSLHGLSIAFFKNISTYLLMAVYSSILISLSYLLIRNKIIESIDMETAGLWEAMNKISMFYMIFFSSLFTLYLLPKLAENQTIQGYNKIMMAYLKTLIPLTIIAFMALFFLRSLIIRFFLTPQFLELGNYFYLQLIGDFIKILAFSFAYQFHAKKMVFAYFFTDAILYGAFYLLSIGFVENFNLDGVFYAYNLSVFLYLIFVLFFVFKLRNKYLDGKHA
ncbi:O-antigen translocase [Flavobacteriaceae bacterium SZ-1-7]|uniref:O-antigen translocase n=1 Tax=Tamlana sedimenti TaxID=3134126 RepID=UPI003122ED4A